MLLRCVLVMWVQVYPVVASFCEWTYFLVTSVESDIIIYSYVSRSLLLNHMIFSILCYGSMVLLSDLIMYISSRLLVALHAMYHYKTSSVTSCYKPFFLS